MNWRFPLYSHPGKNGKVALWQMSFGGSQLPRKWSNPSKSPLKVIRCPIFKLYKKKCGLSTDEEPISEQRTLPEKGGNGVKKRIYLPKPCPGCGKSYSRLPEHIHRAHLHQRLVRPHNCKLCFTRRTSRSHEYSSQWAELVLFPFPKKSWRQRNAGPFMRPWSAGMGPKSAKNGIWHQFCSLQDEWLWQLIPVPDWIKKVNTLKLAQTGLKLLTKPIYLQTTGLPPAQYLRNICQKMFFMMRKLCTR